MCQWNTQYQLGTDYAKTNLFNILFFQVYNYLKMKSEEKGSEDPEFGQDHDDVVDRIFESEDVDKDGVITRAEFSGPKGNGRHEEL